MSVIYNFQSKLYQNIPLVEQMQLQLLSINANSLSGKAPIEPNLNDKSTVFGGSSSALMTICGWSLIKHNLEQMNVLNDVVIYNSQTKWSKAQYDDLYIKASTVQKIEWQHVTTQLEQHNKPIKISINCEVQNQAGHTCTQMQACYVILKTPQIKV